MVLFKESLAQWTPTSKKGVPNPNSVSHFSFDDHVHITRLIFHNTALSREFVEDAVRLLVTRFIPLNPADLEGWMSDPEEWVNLEDKENEQWEYELRVSICVFLSAGLFVNGHTLRSLAVSASS